MLFAADRIQEKRSWRIIVYWFCVRGTPPFACNTPSTWMKCASHVYVCGQTRYRSNRNYYIQHPSFRCCFGHHPLCGPDFGQTSIFPCFKVKKVPKKGERNQPPFSLSSVSDTLLGHRKIISKDGQIWATEGAVAINLSKLNCNYSTQTLSKLSNVNAMACQVFYDDQSGLNQSKLQFQLQHPSSLRIARVDVRIVHA